MTTRLGRFFFVLGVAAAGIASTGDARACGGWFASTEQPVGAREHRVAIAIGEAVTTLWDQVEHSGAPAELAWILPIRGAVVVSVGSDAFLASLDAQTAPVVHAPASECPAAAGSLPPHESVDPVEVTARSVVGPYETAQVHGADAREIVTWLRAHGYAVAAELEPVLQAYAREGFGFVAAKLRPGVGAEATRPIRVSFRGPITSLPLRMARAGAGDEIGVRVLVIADERFKPASHPTFSIDPAMLTWDHAIGRSDYGALRASESAKFAGRAFALESSVQVLRTSVSDEPAAEPVPAVDPGAPSDVGPAPEVSPDASDLDLAFGTQSVRRVTRLRAVLPASALDVDLELERDPVQSVLPRDLQATKGVNDLCAPAFAPMPGDPSCAVRRGPSRASHAAALVVAAALATLRRRRSTSR